MKPFEDILKEAPDVTMLLQDHSMYQAHIHSTKKPELLYEHIALVNSYANKIVQVHGLDGVVNNLIKSIVSDWKHVTEAFAFIKKLFAHAIVFHDFGKVNEYFQVLRMQNKKSFPVLPEVVLHPPHGHSLPGTFLFLCFHIQEMLQSKLPEQVKAKLVPICFFMAYPILQHHSPRLIDVTEKDGYMSQFKNLLPSLKNYLDKYKVSVDEKMIAGIFANIDAIWNVESKKLSTADSFPLFALVKLNFSLLTAADYLATHEYMNSSEEKSEAAINDFGVFENRERVNEIIRHFQSFRHNADTYSKVDNYRFHFPQEKSNANLNRLRQEMAVSVIQTVRNHTGKKLFYIEAPTGGGKTNLSIITVTELLQANPELNKVFYVFPFTTLITQTFGVLKESLHLSDSEIVEMHSKKGITSKVDVKDEEKQDEEMKADGLYGDKKKDFIDNLFALFPVTLLSHVKFFNILKTNRKEDNYLLHRLANSVVIVDEIQSYNPAIWDKMLYFISQYASYFNMRFVLMSATLPKISKLNLQLTQQPEFVDLLPEAHKYITNRNFSERVTFNFELFDAEIELEALVDIVIEKSQEYADEHGSVKTIIEFIYKKSAASFRQLIEQSVHPFNQIFILSGTILEPRRKEIINFIKRSAKIETNILLITTQVVEAGVDIDMDLGFKNISLLDSDEQLAGRVNRNAFKDQCEVYLFKLDDARVLYGKDFRYKQTRERITRQNYEAILKTKNFELLYGKVLNFIDDNNKPIFKDSLYSYEENIHKLRYKIVDSEFKIIDQDTESVFVPLLIHVFVDGIEEGKQEQVFSDNELSFLQRFNVLPINDCIDGSEVWQVYEQLIHNEISKRKAGEFFDVASKLSFKILQGILSKFSFSLLGVSKDYQELQIFGEDKYGFLYLAHWNEERSDGVLYSYKNGLNNKAFSDANFI